MKIDRLDAHDRLTYFLNQEFQMGDCAQDLIDQKPFGEHPFYIFCHSRTHDNGIDKRYIWSPWIWKPRPQTNTLLMKAYPGSDILKIMWILPVRELWPSYEKEKLFENPLIKSYLDLFDQNKEMLCEPEPDDPTAERAQEIAFEYQPLLFKRESLPEHLKSYWDKAKREKEMKERENGRNRDPRRDSIA
jgi:hypothetical protein